RRDRGQVRRDAVPDLPAGHHRTVRRQGPRHRAALPDPHRAAPPPLHRVRGRTAARPVRRPLPLGRDGQADPARRGLGHGPRLHRGDRGRPAGAVHLRPGGVLGPLPARPGRRPDPADPAVQRDRVRRHRGGLLGRTGAVERGGHLPDAGGDLARARRRALPRPRLAAMRPGDAGRAVRLQGPARAADLGRHPERAAGGGRTAGSRPGARASGRDGGDGAMNLDPVRYIADAVLYEGYILYPYRASAQKNQSRWQFGVVMAPGYAAAEASETSVTRAECVLEHTGAPSVTVLLRFLQVQRRTAGGASWDEAVEREVEVTADAAALGGGGVTHEFTVEGGEDLSEGVVRRREPLTGAITVRAAEVPGPWRAVRLQVQVFNRTELAATPRCRDDALPTALVAAHTILTVTGGDFISMTDPPEWAAPAVAECRNEGGWPVLADPDGG